MMQIIKIKIKIRNCLSANSIIAQWLFPLLMEKLEATRPGAKVITNFNLN